jgi:CheY-like chemotaxis protein
MPNKTFLVCDSDELGRRALTQVARDRGLTFVGEADTAVEALQMLKYLEVDVVVITNELQGLSGLEVVDELVAGGYRVVFVAADQPALERARAAGAFAAITRGDVQAFERAVAGIGTQVVPGDRRSGVDRRTNLDRRVTQDWSKVIRERRVSERRMADRRQAVIDLDQPAPDPAGETTIDLTDHIHA